MRYKFILVFGLILAFSYQVSSQSKTNSEDGLKNLFNLTPSPLISNDSKVIMIISELINYGEVFKYHNELLNGNYIIEMKNNEYLIKILDIDSYGKAHNDNRLQIKDVIKISLNSNKKDYINQNSLSDFLQIQNIDDYIDLKRIKEIEEETDNIPFPRFGLVYRNNSLIDKNILYGVVPNPPYNILTRERTEAYLVQHGNNQPASIFAHVTDGVIVPDGGGTSAKVFTTDRMWNRIIFTNKDYTPVWGDHIFASHGLEGSNNGQFRHPMGIDYGSVDENSYRRIYVSDYGNNRIHDMGYKLVWPTGHQWDDKILINELEGPWDVSYHTGKHLQSFVDDKLWITGRGLVKRINCVDINTKSIIYDFKYFNYGNANIQCGSWKVRYLCRIS